MTSMTFQRTTYYISVGVSVLMDKCCVAVDTIAPPTLILQPCNDRKYIIHTTFIVAAMKKAVFGSVISNLRYCGIGPITSTNPDNKYYTGLNIEDLDLILDIIDMTVRGLNVSLVDGVPTSVYTRKLTPETLLAKMQDDERPRNSFVGPTIVVLGIKNTLVHALVPPYVVTCK